MRYRISILIIIMSSLLFIICARQASPPGGPEDKTPPRILATWPASDSTRVPLTAKIQILFSEAVDHKSAEESIFITPFPGDEVKFIWRSKHLEIRFATGLLKNRTYVITIGTGTKDRRNNAMAGSFAFAFSTGDSLDRGIMSGTLYGDIKTEGVQIWAYDLIATPTPDPSQQPPLYITQASSNGKFKLAYVAMGRYRIFAIADHDLNNRYNAEREALAVPPRDYELTAATPEIFNISLRLAIQDTTLPKLAAITASDRSHLDLRFSEKMMPQFISRADNYNIISAYDTLDIKDAFLDDRNSSYVHLFTEPQHADKKYSLHILNGYDLAFNTLAAKACTLSFTGSGTIDSTKPYFIRSIPSNNANFFGIDSTIEFYFSEAMDTNKFADEFRLQDTSKTNMSGRFTWPNGAHAVFTPEHPLHSMMKYSAKANVDSVFDLNGNSLSDTLFVIQFKTINPDTLSEISGIIKDADSLANGFLHIRARAKISATYDIQLPQPGIYRFSNILPGAYTIEMFRDQDGNGRYTYGTAFPFKPAERFFVYPDTVQVRSRWPNEGNDMILLK